MLKAVITGPRRAELVEVPTPQLKYDWALVKVQVVPMCTEYKSFTSGADSRFLGHEAAGEVVDAGQPGALKPGDRVVAMPLTGCGICRHCFSGEYIYCENAPDYVAIHGSLEGSSTYAQYLLKPAWLLCPIPDDLSTERASLACCAIGPSFGAFQRMNVGASDTVLITGAGPVGLGAIVNARFRGARAVVVEGHPYRANLSRELGADCVIDPGHGDSAEQVRAFTGGGGVDKSLDCSGAPEAQRVCIDSTRRRGHVAFIGECYDRKLELTVSRDLLRKGLTLSGSWHYNLVDYPAVIDVIRRSPLIDKLVSHRFPMSHIQDAFEVSASQQCGKILLDPWA